MLVNPNLLIIGIVLNFLVLYFGYGIWHKMLIKDIKKNAENETMESSKIFDNIVIKNSLMIRKLLLGSAVFFSIILLIFH